MSERKRITVLGCGLVGSVMANDLATQHDVTVIDVSTQAFEKLSNNITQRVQLDLSRVGAVTDFLQKNEVDVVVGAVPGFMGYRIAEEVIRAGKNMVDISFFPEDPFGLDDLAKQHGVTIVTDCGVAPGMGNIILGYHDTQMEIKRYECLVGGLPVVREWPWEYKAVFSPIDVIEEYTRPARYVQGGQEIIREALSDAELIPFPGLGTLESWNSDGLRSLIRTMKHIPDMIEKTLRYPGCIEYLRVLRAAGYFSYEPVDINGTMIRPIDLTAKLLFPQWKLKPGEEDFTIMRIIIEGQQAAQHKRITYHLLDRFDRTTNTISMARTTGFTCTAVTNLVLSGKFNRMGICPPEYVGQHAGCYDDVMSYLNDRGVRYEISIDS